MKESIYSKETILLQEELKNDTFEIGDLLKKNPKNQVLRRTYIRTIFAEFEANVYMLKKIISYCNDIKLITLKPDQISIIYEQKYNLQDNGTIKTSNFILNTYSNINFTITFFDRSFLPDKLVNTIDWKMLKASLNIRNKIVHPKSIKDLIISEVDMETIVNTYNSFYNTITNLLNKLNDLVISNVSFTKYFKIGMP